MSFIKKINQLLITHYPTIWNTKIVWVMAIAIGLHLIYFTLGYFKFTDPHSLVTRGYFYKNTVGEHGFIFSILLSFLIIIIWLSQLFKNNAFKSYYPTSTWKLFSTYLQYLIIILSVITPPLSYSLGYKIFLNNKYDDQTIEKYQEIINKATVFHLSNPNAYLPQNRTYPSPFDTLIAVTEQYINRDYPTLTFNNNEIQYFTANKKQFILKDNYEEVRSLIEKAYKAIEKDSLVTIINPEKFVDVSDKVINRYSLYNFSDINQNDNYHSLKVTSNAYNDRLLERIKYNKYVNELLDRNDTKEIENILSNYLALTDYFKIPTNLNTEIWMNLVYHPPHFIVDTFIPITNADIHYDTDYSATEEVYTNEQYYTKGKSESIPFIKNFRYTEHKTVSSTLNKLDNLKSWSIVHQIFLVYLTIAFAMSHILYAFRTTSGKSILFGVITFTIITLLIGLLALTLRLFDTQEMLMSYFILFIYSTIVGITIFNTKTISKNIAGSLVAIVISTIPFIWMLIFVIVRMHEEQYLKNKYGLEWHNHPYPLDFLDDWIPYIIVLFTLITTYIYTRIIRRWKSLPEA